MLDVLIRENDIKTTYENLGIIDGYYLPLENYKIVHINHNANRKELALQVAYAILFPKHDPFNISSSNKDIAEKFADFMLSHSYDN